MSNFLGARYSPAQTAFTVRSCDALALSLCLFDGAHETRLAMTRQDDIYSVIVSGVKPGQLYGFRASGPWDPDRGLCFDDSKLLVDPYATLLDRRFVYDPQLAARGIDTSSLVPKAIVAAQAEPVPHQPIRFTPGGLIYELNVRSFTIRHPEVPAELRGTIAALAHPAIISHLQKLRVSCIELMPITAWIDERHLAPLNLHNAWGYNPVVPMALDPGLVPGGISELRQTVAALHEANIGVILDLVFNHTGESDALGPTLSLRGLDRRYYAREPDETLTNITGTGNTLNCAEPIVRDMVMDTLRHFVREAGVDGFRFDLAPVLARAPQFDPHAPIFAQIAADPLLGDRLLIAEPWDIGPGGYQLGNFPSTWLEWNDRYRDDVRRFWRGDPRTAGTLATRMAGSSDVFAGSASRSVNFVAAHDGFTLADILSYSERHNEANGEGNRDGHGENFSWNNGVEGPTRDGAILTRRKAEARALLATLFASKGAILLTAGDEFGRTQNGNNNAYAQDNEITWLDWQGRDRDLEDFVAALAAFRIANPVLGDPDFLSTADWRDLDGNPMTPEKWEAQDAAGFELRLAHGVTLRIDRSAQQCTASNLRSLAQPITREK